MWSQPTQWRPIAGGHGGALDRIDLDRVVVWWRARAVVPLVEVRLVARVPPLPRPLVPLCVVALIVLAVVCFVVCVAMTVVMCVVVVTVVVF